MQRKQLPFQRGYRRALSDDLRDDEKAHRVRYAHFGGQKDGRGRDKGIKKIFSYEEIFVKRAKNAKL